MAGEHAKLWVWRVKLVVEMQPGVTTETAVARIERNEKASLAKSSWMSASPGFAWVAAQPQKQCGVGCADGSDTELPDLFPVGRNSASSRISCAVGGAD